MKKITLEQRKKAVETGDHFKNGAILKRQTSRRNFRSLMLFALMAGVFAACGDDEKDEEDTSLAAPTNVAAAVSNQHVTLSWNSVRGSNLLRSISQQYRYPQ